MEEEAYVPTAREVGLEIIADLVFGGSPKRPAILDTLVYVVGVSKAKLAKMTGLTPVRVGQLVQRRDPVPANREEQFYFILRTITETWEKDLAAIDGLSDERKERVTPETVPVARAIVTACRKVLGDYEKAQG